MKSCYREIGNARIGQARCLPCEKSRLLSEQHTVFVILPERVLLAIEFFLQGVRRRWREILRRVPQIMPCGQGQARFHVPGLAASQQRQPQTGNDKARGSVFCHDVCPSWFRCERTGPPARQSPNNRFPFPYRQRRCKNLLVFPKKPTKLKFSRQGTCANSAREPRQSASSAKMRKVLKQPLPIVNALA